MDVIEEHQIIYDEDAQLDQNSKGYYIKTKEHDIILLNRNIQTQAEKVSVLAEEVGHYYTTDGDITNQSTIKNKKEELKARRRAYAMIVTIDVLIKAFEEGCRNRFEIAECIGITEEFLMGAIEHYKMFYGIGMYHENYAIMFDPLMIIKMEE